MKSCICLEIPELQITLHPGDIIKLHRFSSVNWTVHYGWYEFEGNRALCGWYLTNVDSGMHKPLLKIDLDDIYVIE